ncbi:MAG: hypothetical protein WC685_10445 [Methylobacter sp.]|jgi:D-arabinose 1-dehydrogenase-like Zn-dependent alcohol dehydrogenase
MTEIRGWATHGPGQKLEPFSYNPGPLGSEEIEIAVEYCGLCHSDLSIINLSKVNDAIEHLAAGNARCRIVLDADFV